MAQCQADDHLHAEQARHAALREEQSYVHRLYARLDSLREEARGALNAAYRHDGNGYGALMDREARAVEGAARLARLSAVENGLCFGRIDHSGPEGDREVHYIGRIGLRDEEREPLLIDWRAPAARPFYAATPAAPCGLVRRRHLHTRERRVVDLDDEVFDLDGLSESDRGSLVGEAALMAALRQGRTGRMGDIVATIQAEQDRVIRSGLAGALVVQGGPGTGKTVAALHRAAYLLYTHRETLQGRGVLVVGPNPVFLRYIGQVLPSLGETDVVLTTLGELYPGISATGQDTAHTAEVKGSTRMAGLVEAAVAEHQRAPEEGLEIEAEGMTLRLDPLTCLRLRDRTRELGLAHNVARKFFVNEMLSELARAQKEVFEESLREVEEAEGLLKEANLPELEDPEAELLSEEDTAYARETLWAEPAVRDALDALWPLLTPEGLAASLLSEADLLHAAAARLATDPGHEALTDTEVRALLRADGSAWTPGDVPLIAEAAVLLGTDDTEERGYWIERIRPSRENCGRSRLRFKLRRTVSTGRKPRPLIPATNTCQTPLRLLQKATLAPSGATLAATSLKWLLERFLGADPRRSAQISPGSAESRSLTNTISADGSPAARRAGSSAPKQPATTNNAAPIAANKTIRRTGPRLRSTR
jgi:hypothetical protein